MASPVIKKDFATEYDKLRSLAADLNRRRPGSGDQVLLQAIANLQAIYNTYVPEVSGRVSGRR